MADVLPDKTYLRKNKDRWPPLHTPILWEKLIPNRAARLLEQMEKSGLVSAMASNGNRDLLVPVREE